MWFLSGFLVGFGTATLIVGFSAAAYFAPKADYH
jgi:hypothetical protein